MNSKSLTGSNEGHCTQCHKGIKGNSAKVCSECSLKFCDKHIKINDNEFTAICSKCFRSKIHLEVSMEMESQILGAKSHLHELKGKLKSSKKDLTIKHTTIDKIQNLLKANEKSHEKKIENYEKRLDEESRRSDTMVNVAENLKEALSDCKYNETSATDKFELSEKEKIDSTIESDILKQENIKLKAEIQSHSVKIKKFISYGSIRQFACNLCKQRIKNAFHEIILSGNQGKDSLIESVISGRDRLSSRKSITNTINHNSSRVPEKDSCNCFIF